MNAIRVAFAVALGVIWIGVTAAQTPPLSGPGGGAAIGPASAPAPSTANAPSEATAAPPASEPLTAAKIKEFAEQTADASDLDEETKKSIAELVSRATEAVEKSNQLTAQTRQFQAATAAAADTAEQHRKQIDQLRSAPPAAIDQSRSLPELEQRLSQLETDVNQRKQSIVEIDGEVANRTARRKAIRARQTELEKKIGELQPLLNQPPPAGEPVAMTTARRLELQSNLQQLAAEIPALSAELAAYDAEDAVDLLQLRRDQADLELAAAQTQLNALQETVQARRAMEASQQVASATEVAESETQPALIAVAERNKQLAEQFKGLTEAIAKIEEQLAAAKATRDQWSETAQGMQEKVRAIGLTDTVGTMLRQQKSTLPNTYRFQSKIDRRAETIDQAQLELLDLQEERARRPDREPPRQLDSAAQRRYADLISKQSEQLSTLVRTQRSYFDKLLELSNVEQQIIGETVEFRNFIDERILWVRSGPPLYAVALPDRDDLWLFDREPWIETVELIQADIKAHAIWYFGAVLVFAILLANRRRFRTDLRAMGTAAESFSCISMSPTVRALSYTILMVLPWPLLFAFLAWRFSQFPTDNQTMRAVANGFATIPGVLLPIDFLRQVCQPQGLGQSHFNWSSQSVSLVRRSLRSLMLLGLPLVLVIAMLDSQRSGRDTVERLMFIAAMLAFSLFASRVLRPETGIFHEHLRRRPEGWAARLQGIWYWALVGSPLLLATLSFFGYSFTAHQLAWRLHLTIVLLVALAIITAFFTRALLVHRRRINIETAAQRRLRRLEQGEATGEETKLPTADELRSQISQSRSLLKTVMIGLALIGIWITWGNVLPALGMLEERPIWRSIKTVAEMQTNDAGDVVFVTHDVQDNVTITDVLFAIIVAIGTAIGARNIPGLLEIAVLKRLPLEPSVRYAIETVVSYIIVLVGLIIAASSLGIHWKQIQWMAAALTFGLAFGLQEMFANFVAGLIMLVERPVRVGDIVTIDDVTGTVSQIRIRATTITNLDQKDYLVPNKDFITGRVLNWTLSNRYNRIVIPVGVAYGSDKDETVRQLLRVAMEHPLVVADPEPTVTFEEFASSSLNYVLRCFITQDSMPSRLRVVHDLHTAIDDAFRKAGITIPFPQQDVHLRSADQATKLE
jgi:potassium efflux system protein